MQDLNSLGVFSVFSDTNNFFFPLPASISARPLKNCIGMICFIRAMARCTCLFRGGPVLYHLKDENGVYGVECFKFKAKKTLDIYKGSF